MSVPGQVVGEVGLEAALDLGDRRQQVQVFRVLVLRRLTAPVRLALEPAQRVVRRASHEAEGVDDRAPRCAVWVGPVFGAVLVGDGDRVARGEQDARRVVAAPRVLPLERGARGIDHAAYAQARGGAPLVDRGLIPGVVTGERAVLLVPLEADDRFGQQTRVAHVCGVGVCELAVVEAVPAEVEVADADHGADPAGEVGVVDELGALVLRAGQRDQGPPRVFVAPAVPVVDDVQRRASTGEVSRRVPVVQRRPPVGVVDRRGTPAHGVAVDAEQRVADRRRHAL